MAIRLRKLNSFAGTSTGVMLILAPFIISIIMISVNVSMGDYTEAEGLTMYVPDSYENMTKQERLDWLYEMHGGTPHKSAKYGLYFKIDFWVEWIYTFPDGYEMTEGDLGRFINGEADEPDWYQVVVSAMTINPKSFQHLGVYGLMLRIILIFSICLGLVELLWLG